VMENVGEATMMAMFDNLAQALHINPRRRWEHAVYVTGPRQCSYTGCANACHWIDGLGYTWCIEHGGCGAWSFQVCTRPATTTPGTASA
jgi:hypothetical protein